jgi:uncharacterized protein YjcR
MIEERKIKRLKDMYDRNCKISEIAYSLGVSTRTISEWLKTYYPERDKYRSMRFNLTRKIYYEKRKENAKENSKS